MSLNPSSEQQKSVSVDAGTPSLVARHAGYVVGYVQPVVTAAGGELRGFHLIPGIADADITHPLQSPTVDQLGSAAAQVLPWFATQLSDRKKHLPADIREHLFLALPLSGPTAQVEHCCIDLQQLCQACDLAPQRLRLEFPERWLASDPERADELLQQLHENGFRLGVSQIGDGLSSLTQLATLPLESLSMNPDSISRLGTRTSQDRVVKALIDLSHSIGLTTTAPGLADSTSLANLQNFGCELVTGDYLTPPLDLTAASQWIERRATTAERQRLEALHGLQLMDTDHEDRFDRITRLAQRVFGVQFALVTLVDEYRQWFKSRAGLEEMTESSRDVAFCDHAIRTPQVMVVEDTQLDARFVRNPFVEGQPHVRFYAGCPLTVGDGSRVGTLCILDVEPRRFSDRDRQLLIDMAALVEKELKADILASTDPLTELLNRRGFAERAQDAVSIAADLNGKIALIFIDLDNLKQINDRHSHAVGDNAIQSFGQLLRQTLRESDLVARYGGDEFVALLINADEREAAITIDRVRDAVDDFNQDANEPFDLNFSVGCVIRDARSDVDIDAMLSKADEQMYQDKQKNR